MLRVFTRSRPLHRAFTVHPRTRYVLGSLSLRESAHCQLSMYYLNHYVRSRRGKAPTVLKSQWSGHQQQITPLPKSFLSIVRSFLHSTPLYTKHYYITYSLQSWIDISITRRKRKCAKHVPISSTKPNPGVRLATRAVLTTQRHQRVLQHHAHHPSCLIWHPPVPQALHQTPRSSSGSTTLQSRPGIAMDVHRRRY